MGDFGQGGTSKGFLGGHGTPTGPSTGGFLKQGPLPSAPSTAAAVAQSATPAQVADPAPAEKLLEPGIIRSDSTRRVGGGGTTRRPRNSTGLAVSPTIKTLLGE